MDAQVQVENPFSMKAIQQDMAHMAQFATQISETNRPSVARPDDVATQIFGEATTLVMSKGESDPLIARLFIRQFMLVAAGNLKYDSQKAAVKELAALIR